MIDIKSKEECCGCGSCSQYCPTKSISFLPDSEGFLYPSVDKSTCTSCNLCKRVCPMLKKKNAQIPYKAYAMQNKDQGVVSKSSSGGVFRTLAEKVLNESGVVFGAKFDQDWNVVISYTETVEGLDSFYGSKYVQALIGNSYIDAKAFLNHGRLVLFSGTPCQIAGLHSFLRKEYENLITTDVSCHGVPSPTLWKKYLDDTKILDISSINFRDKSRGWRNFCLAIQNKNSSNIKNCFESPFLHAFIKNMTQRPSCYNCRFKDGRSNSDITLADFWGIENFGIKFDFDKGTSLVILRNNKWQSFFPYDCFEFEEVSYIQAKQYNEGLKSRTYKHPNRDKFYSELESTPLISKIIYKFLPIPIYHKIYLKILKILSIY